MLVGFFLPVNEENFTDFFPTLSFVSCAPQVEKDSPAWQLLAEKSSFDIEVCWYTPSATGLKKAGDFWSKSVSLIFQN